MRDLQRVRTSVAALALTLSALAPACGIERPSFGGGDPGTPSPPDPWQRWFTETSVSRIQMTARPFCEVVEGAQFVAQVRLAERAWVPLTAAETETYSGGKLHAPAADGIAVLLRCVEASPHPDERCEEDKTRVLWDSGRVIVSFASLRAYYTPPLRKALVAIVPSEPLELYVETLVAIY
jgi:hypothetical protein